MLNIFSETPLLPIVFVINLSVFNFNKPGPHLLPGI
jgi:hypothetical protein